jgi:hypothetical protein
LRWKVELVDDAVQCRIELPHRTSGGICFGPERGISHRRASLQHREKRLRAGISDATV